MEKIIKEIKLAYNDVKIVPAPISTIRHRSECNPYVDKAKHLPIFTAPMTSIINAENFKYFDKFGIIPILPRISDFPLEQRIEYSLSGKWSAYSLDEFAKTWCNQEFANNNSEANNICALIDMANGHMSTVYPIVLSCKKIYGNRISVMIGNIASPESYEYAAKAGADYVRIGIGGGEGCLTSPISGVNYPMASLIVDTVKAREKVKLSNPYIKLPKIIADGGIRNFEDIPKAIALGADYVMIGGQFSRILESAGPCKIFYCTYETTHPSTISTEIDGLTALKEGRITFDGEHFNFLSVEGQCNLIAIQKHFYGMASTNGQQDMAIKDKKGLEGLTKTVQIKYTLPYWVDTVTHGLRTAMSYCNAKTLEEFQANAQLIQISENAYKCLNAL